MTDKIDSVYDFTDKALVELKAWMEPWWQQKGGGVEWEDVGVGCAPTLADLILAEPCLVAFWRLNETSGTVAADSGPGGYDLSPGLRLGPPTWGQPAGPTGELSAVFFRTGSGVTDPGMTLSSVPALTGDFTAEVWVNPNDNARGFLIGQGASDSSTSGWNIFRESSIEGLTFRFVISVNGGSGPGFESDTAGAVGSWYHVVVTRDGSGVWQMYVNGVLQTDSFSPTYTPASGFFVGDDTGHISLGGAALNASFSYAAIYDCALGAESIAAHYAAATG